MIAQFNIRKNPKKAAMYFVILLGSVSLFGDMTYESARSINGQYLEYLKAKASVIGWVAGLGELLGYALRLLSGYITDKTKKYWLIAGLGYALNLLSVPLLALAGYWQIAAILIMTERIGKALRAPARDAMLSFGSQRMGYGWGFGLHEAMDQIGAVSGPILLSLGVLARDHDNYKDAYTWLLVPALISLTLLFLAYLLFPSPENLEVKSLELKTKGFSKTFWIYIIAISLVGMGFSDFPLIAFHLKAHSLMQESQIPLLYALAMFIDAISALVFGKLFDKLGLWVVGIGVAISFLFVPLVFSENQTFVWIGMVLWGIGFGAQDSVMRAAIATFIAGDQRAKAYGLFNAIFGLSWFAGSVLMGYLYEWNLLALIWFSIITQVSGMVMILFFINKKNNNQIILN